MVVQVQPPEQVGSARECVAGSQRRTSAQGPLTSRVAREPTARCLPPGCPGVEDPANLESFGGEDPRPELYLSSAPPCPSPAHTLQRPRAQGLA